MKVKYAVMALVLTSALLASCSSKTSTPVSSVSTTTTAKSTMMDTYLKGMSSKFPNASASTLIQLGEMACDVIDASGSISRAIVNIASDPSWTSEMARSAGYTFGTAIPVFCPEYVPELNRLAK